MTDLRRNVYFFHKQNNETKEQVSSLKQLAESHGFTVAAQPEDAGIIASIGSDGSFLQAVRKTGFRDDCLY
ncbi:NAD kinase, partial [Bacillus velezensis]